VSRREEARTSEGELLQRGTLGIEEGVWKGGDHFKERVPPQRTS